MRKQYLLVLSIVVVFYWGLLPVQAANSPDTQSSELPGFGAVISLLTIAAIAYVTPHLGKDDPPEN